MGSVEIAKTSDDWTSLLQSLLPIGRAWTRDPDADLTKLMSGLAVELSSFDAACDNLMLEKDPRTTNELLTEWQDLLGFPDSCSEVDDSFEEQRAEIVAKHSNHPGGQSREFFTQLAADLGFTVIVWEKEKWHWQVAKVGVGETWARSGSTRSDTKIATYSDDKVECWFEKLKPAHTRITWSTYVDVDVDCHGIIQETDKTLDIDTHGVVKWSDQELDIDCHGLIVIQYENIDCHGAVQEADKTTSVDCHGYIEWVVTVGPGGTPTYDYSTINDAIDDVDDTCTIYVYADTYQEFVNFDQKDLTIIGINGAESCIIDGQTSTQCVDMSNCSVAKLKGFTLKNGSNTDSGGGIETNTGQIMLEDLIVRDCYTDQWGGGINCHILATGSYLKNILIFDSESVFGGGGINFTDCSPDVDNLIIENCEASGTPAAQGNGGGVHTFGATTNPVFTNCIFYNSTAYNDGDEIAVRGNSELDINYSNVEGGQAAVFVDSGCTLNWGSNNLGATQDPDFYDLGSDDYHLDQTAAGQGSTSPCVNTGDPASDMITGSTRTDDVQDSGNVDMGFHYPI